MRVYSHETMHPAVLERRREVALILRRASEAGRFDEFCAPFWKKAWRDWPAIEAVARGLIDPEFEDVAVTPNIMQDYPEGFRDLSKAREWIIFRVNGQEEHELLGPRGAES